MSPRNLQTSAAIAALLLAFTEVAIAADYLKCAMYFNNPPHGGEGKSYSRVANRPWSPDRFRHIPFALYMDGTFIRIDPEAVITESEDGGRELVTYEYRTAPLEVLESNGIPDSDNLREQRAKIVVERHGGVMEITESQNFSAEELAEMRKTRPSGFIYAGTYTKFEILNGQCVPTESRDIFHAPGTEQLVETVIFDTRLCRDLYSFFRLNSTAKGAFFDGVNNSAKAIILDHELTTRDGFGEIPFEKVKEAALGSQLPTESAYLLIRSDLGMGATGKLRAFPSVLARMMLSNCLYQYLEIFLIDESIWDEEEFGQGR